MFELIMNVDSESYEAGRRIGMFIPPVLVGIGILKCLSIARRPTMNSKAVISLLCMLVLWLVLMVVGNFAPMKSMAPMTALFYSGQFLVIGSVSMILAVLGLVEITKSPDVKEGTGQAIGALFLGSIIFSLVGYGVYIGATNVPKSLQGDMPQTQEQIRFVDDNFAIQPPGSPWVRIDAKKINPVSVVGFARANPEMYFIVVPEKGGIELPLTLESYVETIRTGLRTRTQNCAMGNAVPQAIAGINGRQWSSTATVGALPFAYIHWAGVHQGMYYQIVAWTYQRHDSELNSEIQNLFTKFSLIDPKHITHSKGTPEGDNTTKLPVK